MAAKLGILVVHGMGSQPDASFADDMIEEVNGRVGDLGLDPRAIAWKPAFWADVIQPKENELWGRVSSRDDLSYVKVRKFFISSLGDVVAYQRVPGTRADVYHRIHDRLHDHLKDLRRALGDADRPLVVAAHSLGGAIVSNYVWDRQKGHEAARYGGTGFERMETLCGLVTFGCNIPLFSLAYDRIESIAFPPPALPPALRAVASWLNFYDADDVLGYPLKPLSPSYDAAVTEDIEINAGGLLTSWNPLSHSEYWMDDDFTEPVAAMVAGVLRVA